MAGCWIGLEDLDVRPAVLVSSALFLAIKNLFTDLV